MAFNVIDLSTWRVQQQETEGDNAKQWYIDPDTNERWLYKPNRPDRSPYEGQAEVIASRIANLLHIPAAHVELAQRDGAPGCISRNVFGRGNEEIKPDQILASGLENYDPKAKIRAGHNKTNIVSILRACSPPKEVDATCNLAALDWFVSYLLFDALIGNRDRHSSNWALESDWSGADPGCIRLAPSFDHASSLGVSVRGIGLERLNATPEGMSRYPLKGTAVRFEDGANVSLVDYAATYLPLCSDAGRSFFASQYQDLSPCTTATIVQSADLSEASTRLANTILKTNAERIRECLSHC